MASASTSAAQPASLVPLGTVFSWKTVIGAGSSLIGRKSFALVENSYIIVRRVENHYSTACGRNPLINVENEAPIPSSVEIHAGWLSPAGRFRKAAIGKYSPQLMRRIRHPIAARDLPDPVSPCAWPGLHPEDGYTATARFHDLRMFSPAECTPLRLRICSKCIARAPPRTTGLYDRRNDQVSLDEVERIMI